MYTFWNLITISRDYHWVDVGNEWEGGSNGGGGGAWDSGG